MKRKLNPTLIVCLLIVVVMLTGGIAFVINKYMPTKEKMDPVAYYGEISEGQAAVVLDQVILEERGLIAGEEGYLPISLVNAYLNQRFYWDGEGQQVLYATPTENTAAKAASEPGQEVWIQNEQVYLSLSYIKKYTDIDSAVFKEPGRIVLQQDFENVQTVSAKKAGYVRVLGGIKAKVLSKVEKGTSMYFMEALENWVKVATADGYIGYIEKKKLTEPVLVEYDREFVEETYTYITMDEPVNLVWHQVTNPEANASLEQAIANMSGVNVISPTWFSIADNTGNITDISSQEYVQKAHESGLQVWGLTDNFSPDISTTEILSKTSTRQNLIRNLIAAAVNVGLDGINIDFEYLSEEVGIHFLQFLREISIECHANHLVLSVDNPVPEDFTSHYDRAEQGRVVDYVIIMGYDEHYVGSEEAGSVASLPWVEKGIQDTLQEVPAERVINAVPFYARVWKTLAGTLSSDALGMDAIQEILTTRNVETYWDKNVLQHYGEYENDEGAFCQVWVEDADSIAEKVKLVPKYELAGVAAWKLGFENSGIWKVISDNLK